MRADAIVFGIAGTLFGLIIGWILGSQQPKGPIRTSAPVAQSAPQAQSQGGTQAAVVDPGRVKALESVAAQNPKDPQPRVQLGNLFFDAVPTRVMGSGSICFWKDGREVYDHVALIYEYAGGRKLI